MPRLSNLGSGLSAIRYRLLVVGYFTTNTQIVYCKLHRLVVLCTLLIIFVFSFRYNTGFKFASCISCESYNFIQQDR